MNGSIRCGRCLQWLANVCLWIAASSYYDDYIVSSDSMLESNTSESMHLLFTLLGWQHDQKGAKADVFSGSVSALGVVFDLSRSSEGTILVDNTCKRRSDLDSMITSVLDAGKLDMSEELTFEGPACVRRHSSDGQGGALCLEGFVESLARSSFSQGSRSKHRLCSQVSQSASSPGPAEARTETAGQVFPCFL